MTSWGQGAAASPMASNHAAAAAARSAVSGDTVTTWPAVSNGAALGDAVTHADIVRQRLVELEQFYASVLQLLQRTSLPGEASGSAMPEVLARLEQRAELTHMFDSDPALASACLLLQQASTVPAPEQKFSSTVRRWLSGREGGDKRLAIIADAYRLEGLQLPEPCTWCQQGREPCYGGLDDEGPRTLSPALWVPQELPSVPSWQSFSCSAVDLHRQSSNARGA